VLYVYTYFWLRLIRIKLEKILIHTCLEICLLNKFMSPLGIFVAYWLHLSLSSRCIKDWSFSEKSIYFLAIIFFVLFLLYHYTTKTPKHLYLLFPVKSANQYPRSLWVWQPFLYWKVLQLISSTWESSLTRFAQHRRVLAVGVAWPFSSVSDEWYGGYLLGLNKGGGSRITCHAKMKIYRMLVHTDMARLSCSGMLR
jgi:hypothetical protein